MIADIGTYLKSINPLLYGAAAGMVIGFWSRIKDYLTRMTKLLFISVDFNTSSSDDSLERFAVFLISKKKLTKTMFSDIVIDSVNTYYAPKKTFKYILFYKHCAADRNSVLMYKYIFPVFISQLTRRADGPILRVSTLRFVPLWSWLKDFQYYNIEKNRSRFEVLDISGDRGYKNSNGESPTEALIMNHHIEENKPVFIPSEDILTPRESSHDNYYIPEYMQSLYDDVKFFVSSEDWYRERKLTYKRGYLLYGLPGTGKTSFIRVLAEELDIPIYRFDLSSFGNKDFKSRWSRVSSENGLKI